MADTSPDFLGMSDEDFLKQSSASGEAPKAAEAAASETKEVGGEATETKVEKPEVSEGETETSTETKTEVEPSSKEEETTEVKAHTRKKKKAAASAEETEEEANDDDAEGSETESAETEESSSETGDEDEDDSDDAEESFETENAPDYEAFYKKVMTPFKANGRTIELKTPEEAIQLMQMGANYTKKMQELVPHRKVLTMLQNNGLMDEGKLSFLIDLDKKSPEAIQKLLKDSGVDPMEIDTTSEVKYREGNHRVSDEEVAFHTALEDMQSTPERQATLQVIHGDWDQASKEALWQNPGIMTVIHEQRENGIYDRITSELNRRRTLGTIPANVPFLQAYKVIGDEMTQANAFADLVPKTERQPSANAPKVVETRVGAPKPAVTNNTKAAAASTTRQSPRKSSEPKLNPLEMSDDEFMKQLDNFAGRV